MWPSARADHSGGGQDAPSRGERSGSRAVTRCGRSPLPASVVTRPLVVRQYPAVFAACDVCARGPLHRLGCPVLSRVTSVAAGIFAAVTSVIVVLWMVGGPVGNLALSFGLTVFFAAYWAISQAKGRRSR